MDIVIGYQSALEYWRTVGPDFLRSTRDRRKATRRAHIALSNKEKPQLVGGNRRPAGCTLPLKVLVGAVEEKTETACVTSQTWTRFPDASVIDVGEGFLVSTPEFIFLQMANCCSLAQLIQLGFELCGTYALVAYGPATQRKNHLTSVTKLDAFIKANPDVRGCKKVRRALRYVQEGSASPMETVLVMMLCLPYRLGGYGLGWPRLNFRIDVPPSMRKLADREYCKGDLCWPDRHLCVEYDSERYHADEERRSSDARRRTMLAALNYTVVTVTPGQVADSGAFNQLARQVAQLTGKRLRYEDPEFTRTHLALRDELFGALRFTDSLCTDSSCESN